MTGPATKYGIAVSSTATRSTDFGNVLGEKLKADWGTTIDNDGTWRSLTMDEVGYLFSFKGKEGDAKPDFTNPTRQGLNAYNVTVAEAQGVVCLPAAGIRTFSNVRDVGVYSFYWTSQSIPAQDSNKTSAYPFGIGYELYNASQRVIGGSVRLVTEVQ